MKKILSLILIELLCVFLLYNFFYSSASKKNKRLLSIAIKGNSFVSEEGTLQLKGISTMAYSATDFEVNGHWGHYQYYYNFKKLLDVFGFFKKQGINLITLYISPEVFYQKKNEIDYIVKWANINNTYLYFVPIIRPNDGSSFERHKNNLMQLSLDLVNRYRSETNILYSLWAEPNGVQQSEWKSYYMEFIKKARSINNNVIIGVSGLDYGRTYVEDPSFDYKNIFLDFHDYPAAEPEELLKNPPKQFIWEKYLGRFPILIGEFGGVYSYGFGSPTDLSYFKKEIDAANKNRISYVAYTVDNEPGLSLIYQSNDSLTKKGKIFVESLSDKGK